MAFPPVGISTDPVRTDPVGTTTQPVALAPQNAAGTALSSYSSSAYEASAAVKASAGSLFLLTGYNSKASAQWIQVHDAAAVPADAAVPKYTFTVPAQSNFSFDFGPYGRRFATGIAVCNSSTGPTKTVGSADVFWSAEYK